VQNNQTQNSIPSPPSAPLVAPAPKTEIKPIPEPFPEPLVEMSDRAGRSLRKKRSSEVETSGEVENGSNKREKKVVDPSSNRSKRFTWPDGMHRDFVSAIFDVGLKQASPTAILHAMPKTENLSSESIKSYLEQYRVHRSKGKAQFMTCHAASLKCETEEVNRVTAIGETPSPIASGDLAKLENPLALVTTSPSMQQDEPDRGALLLPILSEEEKRSPIGVSLGCLLGLFSSIRSQLMEQRARGAAHHVAASAALVPVHDIQEQAVVWATPSLRGDSPHPRGYPPDAFQDAKARSIASSSTRTDLEENSIMKHEMENQRLFQNTMRALKQQELNKYKHPVNGKESEASESLLSLPDPVNGTAHQEEINEISVIELGKGVAGLGDHPMPADDFWNANVSDEQLFEFLMNP
jgi:SHAQKYF class myb-like DNA-binding protein